MNDQPTATLTISSPQADYDALRFVSPESPCPYLPGLLSRCEALYAVRLDGAQYESLMGRGFRRSGRIVYRPKCRSCDACRPIRIPVARFIRSRSMRRVWLRNVDVRLEVSEPVATPEKFALFVRYLEYQHDDTMARTFEAFEGFLYDSPLDTLEFRYLLGERLIGFSIADQCPGGLSSVYMCFDPDFADRSLGTLSVLREVEHCRRQALPYYYLGYHVTGSRTMEYKSRFRPNEILSAKGCWVSFRE